MSSEHDDSTMVSSFDWGFMEELNEKRNQESGNVVAGEGSGVIFGGAGGELTM